MIYQISAIIILIMFYGFYFAKILIQKNDSLKRIRWELGINLKKYC